MDGRTFSAKSKNHLVTERRRIQGFPPSFFFRRALKFHRSCFSPLRQFQILLSLQGCMAWGRVSSISFYKGKSQEELSNSVEDRWGTRFFALVTEPHGDPKKISSNLDGGQIRIRVPGKSLITFSTRKVSLEQLGFPRSYFICPSLSHLPPSYSTHSFSISH